MSKLSLGMWIGKWSSAEKNYIGFIKNSLDAKWILKVKNISEYNRLVIEFNFFLSLNIYFTLSIQSKESNELTHYVKIQNQFSPYFVLAQWVAQTKYSPIRQRGWVIQIIHLERNNRTKKASLWSLLHYRFKF